MGKIGICSAGCVLACVAWLYAGSDQTFQGEIADSQCALNVHSLTRSHKEMLKSGTMGTTAASCSMYCVKYLGGSLVLTSSKSVYRLDNERLAEKFAGKKVKVRGTLDSENNTIHVVKITADESSNP